MAKSYEMRENKHLEAVMVWIDSGLKQAWLDKLRKDRLNAKQVITHWIERYTGYKTEEPHAEESKAE